jgi:hypothetical protein
MTKICHISHLFRHNNDVLYFVLDDWKIKDTDRRSKSVCDSIGINVTDPLALFETLRAVRSPSRLCSKYSHASPVRSERSTSKKAAATHGHNNGGKVLGHLGDKLQQGCSLPQYGVERVVRWYEGCSGALLYDSERRGTRWCIGLTKSDIGPVRAYCIYLWLGRVGRLVLQNTKNNNKKQD